MICKDKYPGGHRWCMAIDCDREPRLGSVVCAGHWEKLPERLKVEFAEACRNLDPDRLLTLMEEIAWTVNQMELFSDGGTDAGS